MADATFTEEASPPSPQEDKAASPDQPKKGRPKSVNPKRKPASQASSKSPAKITASESPLLAPMKSPKLSKSPKAAKPQNPTMLNMVLEALKTNTSVKGLSLQGIKRYITDKYPHTKESFSNARFRQALLKGTESNEIVRPKSSEEVGLRGYFLLNRALNSEKDKVKPKESKIKKSPGKVKQPAKVAKKTKIVLNTSGSEKTVAAKPKTTKSKLAKSESEPKTVKSKSAKTSEPKTAKSKPARSKNELTTPLKKSTVRKSLKATSTPKIVASKVKATPKLKSTTAGARKKTAAVKRQMKTSE